jgi:hypothetical protein
VVCPEGCGYETLVFPASDPPGYSAPTSRCCPNCYYESTKEVREVGKREPVDEIVMERGPFLVRKESRDNAN